MSQDMNEVYIIRNYYKWGFETYIRYIADYTCHDMWTDNIMNALIFVNRKDAVSYVKAVEPSFFARLFEWRVVKVSAYIFDR